MEGYGNILNNALYNMARERGIQIEQNYNNEYGDTDRLSEIELRKLYIRLKEDIKDLEKEIDEFQKEKEKALIRKRVKVNPIITSTNVNDILSSDDRAKFIRNSRKLMKCMIDLLHIRLNYGNLENAFSPARDYYEYNNFNLMDREGRELDARTSLGGAGEIYKELKQRLEYAKETLKEFEELIDGRWDFRY